VTADKQVTIRLAKSPIGASKRQKATLRALGLRRINQTVAKADRPEIRGMINRVLHLVEVLPHDGSDS